jgi:hypothetical protein
MPAEEHIRYVPEPPSVDSRLVISAAIASLLLVAFAIGLLYEVYQRSVPIRDVPAPQTFSQPRVATSKVEIAERERLTSEQKQRLEGWQWANPEHTLVQIPIERAMQMLAQRRDDAWAPLLPSEPALSSPIAGARNATTPPQSSPVPADNSQPGKQP